MEEAGGEEDAAREAGQQAEDERYVAVLLRGRRHCRRTTQVAEKLSIQIISRTCNFKFWSNINYQVGYK